MHALLAGALKEPLLAITEKEGELLSKATLDVMVCYDLPISETTMAWVYLGMLAGAVYAPRVACIVLRAKQKPTGGMHVVSHAGTGNATAAAPA